VVAAAPMAPRDDRLDRLEQAVAELRTGSPNGDVRLDRLEREVGELRAELRALREELGA
jgi:hypothetical protein